MNNLKRILHHLFIPHSKNNYRAKALHLDFLTFYFILILSFTFIAKQYSARSNILGYATDITVEKLYKLTNDIRQNNKLSPLKYSDKLAKAAQEKANDMFTKNYWAHYSPDGLTPWNFILEADYQYEYAGENLAKNFMFSQGVVEAWMNSPTHRENILRKEYTDVGFAIVNGLLNGEETTLVVQMFATPLLPSLADKTTDKNDTQLQQAENRTNNYQIQPTILGISSLFNLNLLFFTLFLITLSLDLYIATKLKLLRIGGKNIVHMLFIGFIIVALFIIRNGGII